MHNTKLSSVCLDPQSAFSLFYFTVTLSCYLLTPKTKTLHFGTEMNVSVCMIPFKKSC